MISVDHIDTRMPQGIGKGKTEQMLYWFGVYGMPVYQPMNQDSILAWKENLQMVTWMDRRMVTWTASWMDWLTDGLTD